ncbi:MAG: DUF1467 family protein [Stappiaceae bacterium]
MSLPTAMAVYFVIWWIVLFAILPWGVKSQHETDEFVEGTEPAAPVRPMLVRKAIATTITAAVVFAGVYWLIAVSGYTLDDIPLPGRF